MSMSPRDIVTGRRKIILSLVYQLMRWVGAARLRARMILELACHKACHKQPAVSTEPSWPAHKATVAT